MRSNWSWASRSRSGRPCRVAPVDLEVGQLPAGLEPDLVDARLAADAAARGGVEVALDAGGVEVQTVGEAHVDHVALVRRRRGGAVGNGAEPRRLGEDGLGEQEAGHEIEVVPGGAHDHGHGLVVDADLQGLLHGHRVRLRSGGDTVAHDHPPALGQPRGRLAGLHAEPRGPGRTRPRSAVTGASTRTGREPALRRRTVREAAVTGARTRAGREPALPGPGPSAARLPPLPGKGCTGCAANRSFKEEWSESILTRGARQSLRAAE